MKSRIYAAAIAATLIASAAIGQTLTIRQAPVPFLAMTNEAVTQSIAVSGGTLYTTTLRQGGPGGALSIAQSFVPVAAASPLRYLPLTAAKANDGVGLTGTAGSGALGIARTGGTSIALAGEATSSDAKTNAALWETILPDTYVAGANVPLVVNALVTGSGTLTGASTLITPTAFVVSPAGVETALTVSAAQQFSKTSTTALTFAITGTPLVPGSRILVKLTMLVTSASGANIGQINSVALQN